MLIAVLKKNKFIVLFIIIFGTLSLPVLNTHADVQCKMSEGNLPAVVQSRCCCLLRMPLLPVTTTASTPTMNIQSKKVKVARTRLPSVGFRS